MNKTLVHTGLAVATAGGISDALVTVLVWLFSLVHVVVPANVAASLGVLATAAIGFLIHHTIVKPAVNDNAPAAATAIDATETAPQTKVAA